MGNRRAPNKRDKSSGNSLQSYEKFSVRNRERRTRSGSLARRRWIELINEEDRMNCIDRTKTAGILLAVIACIVFASGRASAQAAQGLADRKSTRLNSSHVSISYDVFCLKKKI